MHTYTGANGGCQPEKRFWAKMTKFSNGAFELSVIEPRTMPEQKEPHIAVSKGCAVHFSGSPVGEPAPVTFCARRVRELSEEQEQERDILNRARSVRRARQKVRHLVKALNADHMLTFSYRENVEDIEKLKRDWQMFLRMMRGRYPGWQFVCIRERQERGAFHLHVAVKGKQDIRWILRCWLLAIGQEWEDVQQWYVHGVQLGATSRGAVNVRAPSKRWGGAGKSWRPERLAGYLTKYLGKEFANAEHHSKRYWHSKEIEKPQVVKFWLGASHFHAAVVEAHDMVHGRGANNLSMWAADDWNNLWISGCGLRWELTEAGFGVL